MNLELKIDTNSTIYTAYLEMGTRIVTNAKMANVSRATNTIQELTVVVQMSKREREN